MTVAATTETVVNLTESAVEHVKTLMAQPENSGKNLRVYVEQGGCSGMQYGMVFDERREGDLTSETHGLSVLVDPISADYIRGSVVDFSEALTGGGFKLVNPKARQSCGCGKSFET